MSSLYLYDGGLLTDDGKLANSKDCCCSEGPCYCMHGCWLGAVVACEIIVTVPESGNPIIPGGEYYMDWVPFGTPYSLCGWTAGVGESHRWGVHVMRSDTPNSMFLWGVVPVTPEPWTMTNPAIFIWPTDGFVHECTDGELLDGTIFNMDLITSPESDYPYYPPGSILNIRTPP